MKLIYKGQSDLEIPNLGLVIEKNKAVEIDDEVAELLLNNPDWKKVETKKGVDDAK